MTWWHEHFIQSPPARDGQRLMKVGGFVLDDLQGLHIRGIPCESKRRWHDSVNLKPQAAEIIVSAPSNQRIHLFLLSEQLWDAWWRECWPSQSHHTTTAAKESAGCFTMSWTRNRNLVLRCDLGILSSSQLGHCKQHDDTSEPVTGCSGTPVTYVTGPSAHLDWAGSCIWSGLEDWQNGHTTLYGIDSIELLYIISRCHNTCKSLLPIKTVQLLGEKRRVFKKKKVVLVSPEGSIPSYPTNSPPGQKCHDLNAPGFRRLRHQDSQSCRPPEVPEVMLMITYLYILHDGLSNKNWY